MKLFRSTRGDTIVEVLISITVLSLILTASYALANRSSQGVRQAQERSEALKLSEALLEKLKAQLASGVTPDLEGCLGSCEAGTDNRYKSEIQQPNSATYVIVTKWDTLRGTEDTLSLVYRLYPASAAGALDPSYASPPSTGEPGPTTPTPPVPEPPVVIPVPTQAATISGNGVFGSWHLFNTGGARTTRTFTVLNPNEASLRLTTATITGTNVNVFSITSNGCSNRTLQPSQSCTITTQFYPPSGGTNNRLSNAGPKAATLSVNNSSGVPATSVALSGTAYSDQAGPGDTITDTTQAYLRTYNQSCYNNVEACSSPHTGIAGNGNLNLGGTYCLWGGWGSGGYGNYPFGQNKNKLVMQTDGNLVFYDPYTYRYASWTQNVPNLWLKVIDASGGGVYLHQNNSSVAYKWIHANGSCFAW